jgi:Flp pilus assembly pilin Flp
MLNFKWLKSHKGQGMVEYILIIAVVVGIIFGVYKLMGQKVKDQFQKASETVETAGE